MTDVLGAVLERANIKIRKFDATKARPVMTNASERSTTVEAFIQAIKNTLGPAIAEFPEFLKMSFSMDECMKLVTDHCDMNGLSKDVQDSVNVPEEFKNLTLNIDMGCSTRDGAFFTTTPDEKTSPILGARYIDICSLTHRDANEIARKVIREYVPRGDRGVILKAVDGSEEQYPIFNSYNPPKWEGHEKRVEPKLPSLFSKLVKHLFPLPIEQEYFFHWLHASLFGRAQTFLVLCGAPGVGKNTLRTVVKALHGYSNAVDGKRSTLQERFNSQLSDCTLVWFDELKYDQDMENTMKELPSESVSVERKGVDATRSSKIYASFVISNNRPRDNFLDFNSRKFVPLQLNDKRLEESIPGDDIEKLLSYVQDEAKPTFSVVFLAQIAKWVRAHGKSRKWANLEYRGPMFYQLCYSSMSRWQRKAIQLITETSPTISTKIIYNDKHGFQWSTLQDFGTKRNGERSLQFPGDFSSVREFLNQFLDRSGKKVFITSDIKDEEHTTDFYVKPVKEMKKGADNGKARTTKEIKNREYLDL